MGETLSLGEAVSLSRDFLIQTVRISGFSKHIGGNDFGGIPYELFIPKKVSIGSALDNAGTKRAIIISLSGLTFGLFELRVFASGEDGRNAGNRSCMAQSFNCRHIMQ